MKTFVFLLAMLGLFSCRVPRYAYYHKGPLVGVWIGKEETGKGLSIHAAPDSMAQTAYNPKIQSDYLEKDRDGVFFGNIYKIKQKKNRILLKRQSLAQPSDLETIE